jgi:crotonobetainyl-CoA:carnitine CoA-transferase CaiB-like acyl-CoA transferase
MTLADFGAEVIKVESPAKGDDTREWGPPFLAGESTYFLSVNRSKLGITLDFKQPAGRDLLLRLIGRADVLIENFRAGALDRAGLGYEDLAARFPRLVYCSITGYGHTGPRRSEPGFDAMIQGESGVMSVTGDPAGPPLKMGISVADITTGMYAVQGILAALYRREQTGAGQKVDVALLDSMVSTLTYQSAIYFATGATPQRMGNRHPSIVPYETFEACDGHFSLGVTNDSQWRSFCRALELEDLEGEPAFASVRLRVSNYAALRRRLSDLFRTRTVEHWIGKLRAAGVPCGEVRTVSQALEDPQLRARDMILELEHPVAGRVRCTACPVKMSGAPPAQAAPPPMHGQHNRDVYCGILGLSDEDLARLRREGVI